MKKIIYSFIVLLVVVLFGVKSADAATFVPKYVDIVVDSVTPTLQAGSEIELKVTLEESDLPSGKTQIEYGVVRELVNGNLTQYEPVSVLKTEQAYSKSKIDNLKLKIPNTMNTYSDSTYVFYALITVTDNPDIDNFIISKQDFKIQSNENDSLIKIKFMNFLQSNGKRFGLTHGPTIYDLSKTAYKGVASSTALEITFESNFETTLNPTISFSKLRSDVSVPSINAETLKINKSTTTLVVPLPNFDYNPGAYKGVIDFHNENIPNVEFQYIIAGEMVTFGQPLYTKSNNVNVLDFKIHGVPIDLDLDPSLNNISTSTVDRLSSDYSQIYSTEFVLLNKEGQEIQKIIKDVDFANPTYQLEIPENIKNVYKVHIKTLDSDGTVLYEGTKDLNIIEIDFVKMIALSVLLIVIISLILVFKNIKIRFLLAVLALVVFGFGVNEAKAGEWNPIAEGYLVKSYAVDSAGNYMMDIPLNWSVSYVYFYDYFIKFNTNITTEKYDLNDDVILTYKIAGDVNNLAGLPVSISSILSLYDSEKNIELSKSSEPITAGDSNVTSFYYDRHNSFVLTSGWVTVNLSKPAPKSTIYAKHVTPSIACMTPQCMSSIPIFVIKKFDIPLLNIVNNSLISLVASADNVTDKSARINWVYTDTKPQVNYKVEISKDSFFPVKAFDEGGTMIIQGAPPVISQNNILDSFVSIIEKFNPLYLANAQTNIGDIRNVTATGLAPSTKYYAKVSVYNGEKWTTSNTSFTTLPIAPPDIPADGNQFNVTCVNNTGTKVLVGTNVNLSATVVNNNGNTLIQWNERGSNTVLQTGPSYTVTQNTVGTYIYEVSAQDNSATVTSSCGINFVTSLDGGDPPANGCTGDCKPQVDLFKIHPNYVDKGTKCGLELKAINTSGCKLYKTQAPADTVSVPSVAEKINFDQDDQLFIGPYELKCTGTGIEAINEYSFGVKYCYSNPSTIQE